MLFFFPIKSLYTAENEEELLLRGISVINDSLCIGVSNGNILVLKCSARSVDTNDFPLLQMIGSSERVPISCLTSSFTTLVAANENGKLFGYDGQNAFESMFVFPSFGYPCTTMCQRNNVVFAGYSSGHVRIYRTDIMELVVEIAAHVRCITAMVLHPSMDLLCSVSQDQRILVWSTPTFTSLATSSMSLVHSEHAENKMCTGVAFIDNDRISVSSYDDEELLVLRKNV